MEEDHGEHPGDLRVHRGAGIVSSRQSGSEKEKRKQKSIHISDFVQVGLQTGTPVLLEAEDRLLL